jgi:hypothetical protein
VVAEPELEDPEDQEEQQRDDQGELDGDRAALIARATEPRPLDRSPRPPSRPSACIHQ